MVRLMLVLAPAACCLAAIAMSELMQTACKSFYLPPVEHEVEEIPVGVKVRLGTEHSLCALCIRPQYQHVQPDIS